MLPLDVLITGGLVTVAATGAWYDVRERRVPNELTVGGLALALALSAFAGWNGLLAALAGAGIAFAVALPVFLAGGLGGGDVKLLTAVGAFLGPGELPAALAAIAIVGGLMAAVEVIRQGAVKRTLSNIGGLVRSLRWKTFSRWKGRASGEPLTVDAEGAITVPYAVAIAVGAVLAHLVL